MGSDGRLSPRQTSSTPTPATAKELILEDTDEDEVREMFLRLQNGTTLKAQEKRNAMPGAMRDFIKGLVDHPFFGSCFFSNMRYNHDLD